MNIEYNQGRKGLYKYIYKYKYKYKYINIVYYRIRKYLEFYFTDTEEINISSTVIRIQNVKNPPVVFSFLFYLGNISPVTVSLFCFQHLYIVVNILLSSNVNL
jgi:hypothetical protein